MILSPLLGIVLILLVLYVPMPLGLLYFVLFCFGMSNTGVALGYALSGVMHRREVTGMSIAFANMASVIIGSLFQPVVGKLLDDNWGGMMKEGMRFYGAHDFHTALLLLPLSLFLAFVVAFFVREHPVPSK